MWVVENFFDFVNFWCWKEGLVVDFKYLCWKWFKLVLEYVCRGRVVGLIFSVRYEGFVGSIDLFI